MDLLGNPALRVGLSVNPRALVGQVVGASWRRWRGRRTVIEAILNRPGSPACLDETGRFAQLQAAFPPRTAYAYDRLSLFRRGAERAARLVEIAGLVEPGARVLEMGCGDGTTGSLLHGFGHDVTLADLDDWRDGSARTLPLVLGDICAGLPLPPGQFDLVYSYNTWEHVPDPAAALTEAIRLTRPGGLVYLRFGPLFASAWGLHAYKTLTIPYAQFLFTEDYLATRLGQLGIRDLGRDRVELQPLNRWRLDQFERSWTEADVAIVRSSRRSDPDHLRMVRLFPDAFRGRGLTFDDLTVKTLEVALRVPELTG